MSLFENFSQPSFQEIMSQPTSDWPDKTQPHLGQPIHNKTVSFSPAHLRVTCREYPVADVQALQQSHKHLYTLQLAIQTETADHYIQ